MVGGLGEGAAQRGVLGLPYSVSKKGGECTGKLLLIPFITELTLQKDSCVCVCVFSHSSVSDSAILWTIAHQAPLSMRLSRQEYLVGGWLPFPSPGDLPGPGVKPISPALAGEFFASGTAGKPVCGHGSEQTLGGSEGQASLARCGLRVHRELDTRHIHTAPRTRSLQHVLMNARWVNERHEHNFSG